MHWTKSHLRTKSEDKLWGVSIYYLNCNDSAMIHMSKLIKYATCAIFHIFIILHKVLSVSAVNVSNHKGKNAQQTKNYVSSHSSNFLVFLV